MGDRIVASFPFNGSLINEVGTGDGTYAGTPTYPNDSPYNRKSFQGSTAVDGGVAALVNIPEKPFTLTLWFKTTNSTTGSLFGVYGVPPAGGGIDRTVNFLSGNIQAYLYNGGQEWITSSSLILSDNKWHHVAYTYGGSTGGQELYIDAKKVAKGAFIESVFTWQNQIIMGNFQGLISDVRIYDATIGG